MADSIFILGGTDPEMQDIERLLVAEGFMLGYAAVDGVRVHPGNAYKATGVILSGGVMTTLPDEMALVLVECDGPVFSGRIVTRCDHHRPGDPGFGRPPAEYWLASSLGQVVALVASFREWPIYGRRITAQKERHGFAFPAFSPDPGEGGFSRGFALRDAAGVWRYDERGKLSSPLLVAAADHCLGAAYEWECPGVDPERLMEWRAETRAAFQNRSVQAVLEDIQNATDVLEAAPRICLGGVAVADMRNVGHTPELPEASVRTGTPFIARIKDRDGRNKVVLQSAPEEAIRDFMSGVFSGLTGYYGDPERGFAGAYEA